MIYLQIENARDLVQVTNIPTLAKHVRNIGSDPPYCKGSALFSSSPSASSV